MKKENHPLTLIIKEKKILDLLFKMGIVDLESLVFYTPYRYKNKKNLVPLFKILENQKNSLRVCTKVLVSGFSKFFFRGRNVDKIHIREGNIEAELLCFGRPYIARQVKKEEIINIYGVFYLKNNIISSSDFEFDTKNEQDFNTLVPVYKLTKGILQKKISFFNFKSYFIFRKRYTRINSRKHKN